MQPKIAIVGNAAYLKDMGLGAEIDSHDTVVRLNLGFQLCALWPEDVGRRTDINYVSNGVYGRRNRYGFPGVVRKKRHVLPKLTYGFPKYEANTGLLAIAEYAGEGVKVYGMDFFSVACGGLIPEEPVTGYSGEQKTVPRKLIYMDGYAGVRDMEKEFVMTHIGGLRDFRVFMYLRGAHDIRTDDFLSGVIEKNKHRI